MTIPEMETAIMPERQLGVIDIQPPNLEEHDTVNLCAAPPEGALTVFRYDWLEPATGETWTECYRRIHPAVNTTADTEIAAAPEESAVTANDAIPELKSSLNDYSTTRLVLGGIVSILSRKARNIGNKIADSQLPNDIVSSVRAGIAAYKSASRSQ